MSSSRKVRDRAWQQLVNLVMDSRWDWRRRMSEAAGLPFSRVRALDRLRRGPLTLRELAQVIGTDAPATTTIVNDLHERGLVTRKEHPEDRRAKMVALTPGGQKLIELAKGVNDRAPAILDRLEDEEVRQLLQLLGRLGSDSPPPDSGGDAGAPVRGVPPPRRKS
jgi:DNA-binding MarR family transcriptional regulator